MINSELREYCEDVISYYSSEYPYYFMHTNTTVTGGGYWQQYGATICLSKTKPTVKSQYTMHSDEWLVITVYNQNASRDDNTPRVLIDSAVGNVSCDECEFVYSNVESIFCYASVDVHNNTPLQQSNTISNFYGIFISAVLFGCLVALWLRRL